MKPQLTIKSHWRGVTDLERWKTIEFSSGDYNPIPAGQLKFATLMKPIPEELKQLGKIAYTLLCNRGVYPMPQQGQGPRDSAAEFAN
jgi:hypothetical protein